MTSLLKFREVSLFKNEEFGVKQLSLDIQKRQKYHFVFETQDRLNAVLGLVEGRYKADSGIVVRADELFMQSDRLLMGDKVYSQNTGKWLALYDEFFYFDGKRRSKRTFIDLLQARSIRHFPIHRLRGDDKLKFVLLSLTFQESGVILINRLLTTPLSKPLQEQLDRIVNGTRCALCLFSCLEKPPIHPIPLEASIKL
ncbi:MAG: hypothetical protein GY866_00395 [Proteobacteria bacterium]|nr:hypothetical protein [Pseudomonadota bacterium]